MPSPLLPMPPTLAEFHRRLDAFVGTYRITRKALSEVMGFPAFYFTISHQLRPSSSESVLKGLCGGFTPTGILRAALHFRLPSEGYDALEEMADLLFRAVYGWPVQTFRNGPAPRPLDQLVYREQVAKELYCLQRMELAIPYMEEIWEGIQPYLDPALHPVNDRALCIGLKIGANFIHWATLTRQPDRVRPYRDPLLRLCAAYRGRWGSVLFAMGGFYNACANASLTFHQSFEPALKAYERAYEISIRIEQPLLMSNTLRGISRVYMTRRLERDPEFAVHPGDAGTALHYLERSEAVTGGTECEGGLRLPWAYSRLIRINYLMAADRDAELLPLWEELNGLPWLAPMCEESAYLALKVETGELAVRLARRDLDGVGRAAERILQNPRYVPFTAPRERIAAIRSVVGGGDDRRVRAQLF